MELLDNSLKISQCHSWRARDAGARVATLRVTLTPALARVLHSAGARLAPRPSLLTRGRTLVVTRASSTPGSDLGGGAAGTLERGGGNNAIQKPSLSPPMTAAEAPEEIRAAVYDRKAQEGIKVVTKRAPKPRRGDVLVRVKACGVNPVDAKFVLADKLPESWRGTARWLVDGHVAGFDLSGVVERTCPGSGFEVGEEVFGAVPPLVGSFADLVSVPPAQLSAKPKSLTHAEAASLVLPGLTVVQALRQHGFRPGCRVLVIGASGGVGHIAVQVAAAEGAGLVVGVVSFFYFSCGQLD